MLCDQDRALVDKTVADGLPEIWDIARYIHAHPELGFKEYQACEVQSSYLERRGFAVTRGPGGLKTAYVATHGSGKPVIGICAEYDALREIGHACGHNLICSTSMLTGIAVRTWLERQNVTGTVKIIGTPAEEGGGGKIRLLEAGVFDGVEAIYMMHPTSAATRLAGPCMSVCALRITLHGKAAHAASHPDQGRNALSAATLFLNAMGLWRQQAGADIRSSLIMTEGGKQSNTIPDLVRMEGDVRAFSLGRMRWFAGVMRDCATHCAAAMECTCEVQTIEGYQGRVPNEALSEMCREAFDELDEPTLPGLPEDFGGEDLGNISRVIPICNPYVTIFADHKISGHTPQFRELAASNAGLRCIEVASKAMARAIIEVFKNPDVLDTARAELAVRLEREAKEASFA